MAKTDSDQVFDVSEPDKTAPTPTSRPVIGAHGPMMKDPMVSEDPKPAPKEETKSAPTMGEKVIAPLNDDKPTPKPEETVKPPEKPAPGPDAEAKSSEAAKQEAEAAVVEAVAGQTGKKKAGVPSKEEVAREAELEKLVEEKKYYVPIGQVTHRRRVHHFIIFIVVLLFIVVLGGYLAVDANMIDLNIKLPYEFIP